VILVPIFDDAVGADLLESVTDTMYPVFDMLLVAVVEGISASPTLLKGPRWQFLVLGMLLFTGAYIVYALLVLNGQARFVGTRLRNRLPSTLALAGTLVLFVLFAAHELGLR